MLKKNISTLKICFVIFLILGATFGNTQMSMAQSDSDWSVPVNLSSSGIASNPLAVVDFRGTIHVIWADAVDEGFRYSQSRDGVKWSFPVSVKFPFEPKDPPPMFLADKNGSIHVFWTNRFSEFYYGQANPDNFGNPSEWIVTRLSRHVSNFDVIVDARGILHLAYIENVTDELGYAGIYYVQSIVGGGYWSDPVGIYRSEYFRATTAVNSYIRVATSFDPAGGYKVYISWDNRPQKRIFLASSSDDGLTWSGAQQFKGPDDTGGFGSPFNISIWANEKNVLLMWQVGEPGASKCSVYSQWSRDDGKTWGDTITLFGGPTTCPAGIKFVFSQGDKVAVLLSDPNAPVLLAWDGTQWSESQIQIKLPSLSNPDTYDAILLGCRQDIFFKDKLFVVGCDEAKGGDVWFLSRTLLPLDEWFSTTSVWSDPAILEKDAYTISDLSSVTDAKGNIHVVWVEDPMGRDDAKPFIQYSLWDGSAWSSPETIIRNLDAVPRQLAMYLDSKDRVMLTWVDGTKGDLLFSWANLNQAGLGSGWEESTVLPSPSQLSSSPDMAADASGRILVAYAVPYNENRGIYIVQSTDNGVTWSPYVKAFDGVLAQWEFVDSPKITLSGDGVLHLLFTRRSTRGDQPVGLYYSKSSDGGVTWTDPQIVSEGAISWSDIVAYDQQTVHRLWQDDNGLVVANLSQESKDGGENWGKLLDVTGVSEHTSQISLVTNGSNQMYFVQLSKENVSGILSEDKLLLQEWKWDGSKWSAGSSKNLSIKGKGTQYGVVAGVSSSGYLGIALSAEYSDTKGELRNEVLTLGHSLENFQDTRRSETVIMPTPFFAPDQQPAAVSTAAPTQIVDLSVLNNSNDPSEGITKNLVGIGLIGVAVVITLLLLIRRNPKKARKPEGFDRP